MPRLRRRLDALQGDAHGTLAVVRDVLLDFQDGISITVVNTGEGTVMDFLLGKTKTLPIKLVVTASE